MKMKASELRIGNYVLGLTGKPFEVVCSVDDGRIATDNENSYNIHHIDAIPLTDEWLLDFKAELFPWGWVLNEILIRTNHKGKYWIELGNGKCIQLPYVHTLQNFFALTGEELTIKK
jgi:hypothetical protein